MEPNGFDTPVLVGQSPRIRHVRRLIEKLGACRWPVLLLGETGTGKEVVARAIHNTNPAGPFVPIDCSSLVGPLMESELFGHVKGSFTGAIATKIGLIEQANGGTAFLDEIGELPLDLQAKLLRVLQEKEFRPVGSLGRKKSDFRVIAATNRDLAAEVERGAFRRDLYYRLSVVNIRMAPLRERREDIAQLIDHFLSRYGRNLTITQEVVDALVSYDWPGNVRELENCVQHMVAINSGPLVHLADLPTAVQNAFHSRRSEAVVMAAAAGAPMVIAPAAENSFQPAPRITVRSETRQALAPEAVHSPASPIVPLAELEKREIYRALEYTKGDRVMAAQLLGIGRTTLYRKLKEYQINENLDSVDSLSA